MVIRRRLYFVISFTFQVISGVIFTPTNLTVFDVELSRNLGGKGQILRDIKILRMQFDRAWNSEQNCIFNSFSVFCPLRQLNLKVSTYQLGKGSPPYRLESFSIVCMKLPTATHTNRNRNVTASPRNRLRTAMRCVVNLQFPRLRLVVPALTSLRTRAHVSSSTLAPVLVSQQSASRKLGVA